MKLPIPSLLALLPAATALLPLALAALTTTTLTGTFLSSPLLPNPSTLPPSTTLSLSTSGITKRTLITRNNKFTFHNLTSNSYLLDIHCPTHIYHPLRIDIDSLGNINVYQTFRGNEWGNKGEFRGSVVELTPVAQLEYYVKREGFSPAKLLGSPMILIAVVSLGAIMFVPKIIDMIDPELKAEFEEQQKSMAAGGGANPLAGFDVAGFLAGTGSAGGGGNKGGEGGKKGGGKKR